MKRFIFLVLILSAVSAQAWFGLSDIIKWKLARITDIEASTGELNYGAILYGYTNASSYDSAMMTASKTPNTNAQEIVFSGVTNGQDMASFLSDDLVTAIREGHYKSHFHVEWDARSHPQTDFSLTTELYVWESDTIATQEVESVDSSDLVFETTNTVEGVVHVNETFTYTNDVRQLYKLKAHVTGSYTVGGKIIIGGDASGYLEFPAPAGFFARTAEMEAADDLRVLITDGVATNLVVNSLSQIATSNAVSYIATTAFDYTNGAWQATVVFIAE